MIGSHLNVVYASLFLIQTNICPSYTSTTPPSPAHIILPSMVGAIIGNVDQDLTPNKSNKPKKAQLGHNIPFNTHHNAYTSTTFFYTIDSSLQYSSPHILNSTDPISYYISNSNTFGVLLDSNLSSFELDAELLSTPLRMLLDT